MALLILAIVVATLGIFFSSHYFMHDGFNMFFTEHMDSMRKVVDVLIETRKKNFLHEALLIAHTSNVEEAYFNPSLNARKNFAKEIENVSGSNFIILFDSKGIVCFREDVPGLSNALANNSCVREALAGKTCVDILEIPDGLALVAAAPFERNGKVLGAVVNGEIFKTHRFVNMIKDMTGLEVTVFQKDKRISTTINHDGERAVGTLLNNDQVSNDVLKEGKIFSDNAKIFDIEYKTVYWPIQDRFGKIIGMWFVGREIQGFEYLVTAIALSCLLAACTIAIALSFFGVLFLRSIVNPLEKKAYIDVLTGITNRAGFEIAIKEKLSQKCEGTFFLIDLDNFKTLNDTLGHPVGDKCLRATSKVLKHLFRDSDVVARLGGDEFTVYAPTIWQEKTIRDKAEMILKHICRNYTASAEENKVTVRITASIGIAQYPKDGKSYRELYKKADSALYETKESGRRGYTVFGSSYVRMPDV